VKRWWFILLAVVLGWFTPAHAFAHTRASQAAYDVGSSLEKVVYVAGITMDTYQGFNQVPISLHKYLYCRGNPVNWIDPSGDIPILSNFFYGNRVHQLIYDHFLGSSLGATRVADQAVSAIIGVPYTPFLTAGRPDLVQYPDGIDPGEVFEVKPVGSFIEGQVQLQWYLTMLNALDPQRRKWTAGSNATYTPPPLLSLQIGVFAVVSPPIRGVILYQVEDLRITVAVLSAYFAAQIADDIGQAILINTLAPVF